ncbi:class I SAM-dependent rRNA methyltransferase [Altibacter sp. HG106]|uniref:class I SAM-dependent rRNA methyltransferase n=1 Tax=Altibacter sp. HG106 TaxID=3023937 RepID=UPI0023505275|nr:class I SAM-dependent rRNA methyltransferase [Altibacter sp. HG106]MDC7993525.1 class I SAM-dependent rRNA methyltransferase [Altibacter sp. HG106]
MESGGLERTPKRLAVKLSAAGERIVRSGHPWIFSKHIVKCKEGGKPGDIAVIFGQQSNTVMGIGLFDPLSPIRIKMIHAKGPALLDSTFFSEKIAKAKHLRTPLLATQTNSYRLLFGENDGLPGLIADVFDKVLVVKLYSAIWIPFLNTILPLLEEQAQTETTVIRLNRMLQKHPQSGLSEGMLWTGTLPSETIPFLEHGIKFQANVIKGHKTGYFLDHRHNRKRVGEMARGKTVLDVFSYAGGFSVHALAGGATEVTSVDISAQALAVAEENAALNSFSGTHETVAGDAFEVLEQWVSEGRTFDMVVIDPPSFAKRASEIPKAIKKYHQLALLGAQLVAPQGTLVLASCSSRIKADQFFEINNTSLQRSGSIFSLVHTTRHDIDHPVTFPEGWYLKCGYYRKDKESRE